MSPRQKTGLCLCTKSNGCPPAFTVSLHTSEVIIQTEASASRVRCVTATFQLIEGTAQIREFAVGHLLLLCLCFWQETLYGNQSHELSQQPVGVMLSLKAALPFIEQETQDNSFAYGTTPTQQWACILPWNTVSPSPDTLPGKWQKVWVSDPDRNIYLRVSTCSSLGGAQWHLESSSSWIQCWLYCSHWLQISGAYHSSRPQLMERWLYIGILIFNKVLPPALWC